MLELVNARTIPEKLVYAPHLHFIAYFEGELRLRGRSIPGGVAFMSVLRLTLDESHCQQGGEVYDSSSFAFGMSDVRLQFLLVTGGGECALIWLSVAYCEGMHFGLCGLVVLSFCVLFRRLC